MEFSRERDVYLETVLVGGCEPMTIVIEDQDPEWPARFKSVRDRVKTALGGRAFGIEHIGSTAVPGLAAKPIIDVLLIVLDVEDEAAYRQRCRRPASSFGCGSPATGCSALQ